MRALPSRCAIDSNLDAMWACSLGANDMNGENAALVGAGGTGLVRARVVTKRQVQLWLVRRRRRVYCAGMDAPVLK